MIDHDRLFKELLTAHAWEFIELFMPEVADYLEKGSLQLADKELFADIPGVPRQEADLVFKGRFKSEVAFFLIHFEHQSTAPTNVPKRMLDYFFRLTEKYGLPVYPVVIYSHQCPEDNSSQYKVAFPNREVLVVNFHQIALRRMSWRNYLAHANPITAALMTLMRVEPTDRVRVKLECLRMLVKLKLDRKKMRYISGFIDNYLQLNMEEALIFAKETDKLSQVERGKVMEMTTSWKEEGLVEGLEKGRLAGLAEGRKEGRLEGQRRLMEKLLKRQCGALSKTTKSSLQELSSDKLEKLADALLDFKTTEDLESWLYRHA